MTLILCSNLGDTGLAISICKEEQFIAKDYGDIVLWLPIFPVIRSTFPIDHISFIDWIRQRRPK